MAFHNVTIKEHSLDRLAPCATFGVFGKRRTGKSTLAAKVVAKLAESGVGRVVVYCGNRENQLEWARVVHPLFIHGKDLKHLDSVIEWQDTRIGKDREAFEDAEHRKALEDPSYHPREYEIPNHLRLIVILDDVGNSHEFMHSKTIRDLTSNGRHFGIDLIMLLQYITQMYTDSRSQLDYVGMLQTANTSSVDRVYKEYVGTPCCDLKVFHYLLSACTGKKGRAMWIDNTAPMSIERIFFVTIPWPVPRILLGHKKFIDFGRSHYLSTRRQSELQKTAPPAQDARSTLESQLSQRLCDDDDAQPDDDEVKGSIVSLNRKRLNVSKINEGRHTYNDVRGNKFSIQLVKNKME